MDEPKEIYAQQLAKNLWGQVVDDETLDERFGTAKEAVDFGREKYGIEPKDRMMKNSQGSTTKGVAKKSSKKNDKSSDPEKEEPQPAPRRTTSQKFTLIGIFASRRPS